MTAELLSDRSTGRRETINPDVTFHKNQTHSQFQRRSRRDRPTFALSVRNQNCWSEYRQKPKSCAKNANKGRFQQAPGSPGNNPVIKFKHLQEIYHTRKSRFEKRACYEKQALGMVLIKPKIWQGIWQGIGIISFSFPLQIPQWPIADDDNVLVFDPLNRFGVAEELGFGEPNGL